MKRSMTVTLWVVLGAAVMWLTPAVRLDADDVFRLQVAMQGSLQDDVNGTPAIGRYTIKPNAFINLALGRSVDTKPATNEVLAVVVDCSGTNGQMIVYNTATASNLATIATFEGLGVVATVKKAEFVVVMDVESVGSSTNRVHGGELVLACKASLDTNGCPTKISATAIGVIDVVITDDVGTQTNRVLISKGTLTTQGKPIASQ